MMETCSRRAVSSRPIVFAVLLTMFAALATACSGEGDGVQFTAPDIPETNFRLSAIELRAYDGLSLRLNVHRRQTQEARTPIGGIVLTAQLHNTSGQRLFIPVFGMNPSGPLGPRLVSIQLVGAEHPTRPFLEVEDSRLELSADGTESGFFVDAGESVQLTIATTNISAHELDQLTLEIDWQAATVEGPQAELADLSLSFSKTGEGKAGNRSLSWTH